MNISVFLSNREVIAVEGVKRRGNMIVHRVCRGLAPEKSIINGIVTDEQAFDRFFHEFWEEHQLPVQRVTLVLGSAQAVSRYLRVPRMSHKDRMRYLAHEFAGVARTKDPVISYVKMETRETMDDLLVNMSDREFLEGHIRRMEQMGIRLKSIVIAETADIMALNQIAAIRKENCVVQILDGTSILHVLYVDGHYVQMNRTRIFSEPGTKEYGQECACLVSDIRQFVTEQMPENPVTHVYLSGEFDASDYEACRCSILQTDRSLKVGRLTAEPEGRILFASEEARNLFARCIAPIGGLLVSGKKNNLLYQYRAESECGKRKKQYLRYLWSMLAVAGIPGMIAAGQWMSLEQNRAFVEKQQAYLCESKEVRMAAECELLKQELEELHERTAVIEKTDAYLKGHPAYTAKIHETLQKCADEQVEYVVRRYNGTLGMVTAEIRCDSPEHIHRFVKRLELEHTVFEHAEYDGFVRDDRQGRWTAEVRLYLAVLGGAE